MNSLDFTGAKKTLKGYSGANGSKIQIIYEGKPYMLKFPPKERRTKEMSYSNSCISEFLGYHIFNLLGVPAQKTLLGTYNVNGTDKVVVACADLTANGEILQDFAMLKNQAIDSERNGYGTELSDLIFTFHCQDAVDPIELENRFWDMFIVDALIGNWDRHNGNWGFLYDQAQDSMSLAPVFDCGSSLCPDADEGLQKRVLADENELNLRVYNTPTSAIMENGKRINYCNFISSFKDEGCCRALERIYSRLCLSDIADLVLATPYISEIAKEFYCTLLTARAENVIGSAANELARSRGPISLGSIGREVEEIAEQLSNMNTAKQTNTRESRQ